MIDKLEFGKILAVLEDLYPRFKLEARVVEAYYAILKDLPVDLLKAAALQIGATSKWFPAASELRSAAFDLVEHEDGVPTAGQAWGEVVRKIGTDGYIRTPEFSHPLVGDAVEAVGGWRELCFGTNFVADRARYLQVYEALVKRQRFTVAMLPEVREVAARLSADRKPRLEKGD